MSIFDGDHVCSKTVRHIITHHQETERKKFTHGELEEPDKSFAMAMTRVFAMVN